jgi:hypothetical protein
MTEQLDPKDCRLCKHRGVDPDGAFCGHPDALAKSCGFGLAPGSARDDTGPCGPDGTLWEEDPQQRYERFAAALSPPRYLDLYKVGDIIRYDHGPTALMKITTLRAPYGGSIARYWGVQCMGGIAGAYHEKIRATTEDDIAIWETQKKWRIETEKRIAQEKEKHHEQESKTTEPG